MLFADCSAVVVSPHHLGLHQNDALRLKTPSKNIIINARKVFLHGIVLISIPSVQILNHGSWLAFTMAVGHFKTEINSGIDERTFIFTVKPREQEPRPHYANIPACFILTNKTPTTSSSKLMIDTSNYRAILHVRKAYLFDIGGFLTRIYAYMRTVGTVSMLTLAGYNFVEAGLVSSVIAFSMFALSPSISRLIDRRGQTSIVALFTTISMTGLLLLLIAVSLHLPIFFCLLAAIPMGTLPMSTALVRARWIFLLNHFENLESPESQESSRVLGSSATSGTLKKKNGTENPPLKKPSLKAVLSYEGVLDDIAFMIGPALSVALAASAFPTCSMLTGGIFCIAGTFMLLCSRNTDPGPQAISQTHETTSTSQATTNTRRAKPRSVFATNGVVRLLTIVMFIIGLFFGVLDTGLLGFSESIGKPTVSSVALVLESIVSVLSGFAFGMLTIKKSPLWQLVTISVLFGGAYSLLFLVNSAATLIAFATIASFAYAPFLITCNMACERTSPAENLTEALTWLSTGSTLGLAIGPTLGGLVVDNLGALSTFSVSAALSVCVPLCMIACIPLFKRHPKMTEIE